MDLAAENALLREQVMSLQNDLHQTLSTLASLRRAHRQLEKDFRVVEKALLKTMIREEKEEEE
eukprot:12889696-Prorocentrum_lima.AAC.1